MIFNVLHDYYYNVFCSHLRWTHNCLNSLNQAFPPLRDLIMGKHWILQKYILGMQIVHITRLRKFITDSLKTGISFIPEISILTDFKRPNQLNHDVLCDGRPVGAGAANDRAVDQKKKVTEQQGGGACSHCRHLLLQNKMGKILSQVLQEHTSTCTHALNTGVHTRALRSPHLLGQWYLALQILQDHEFGQALGYLILNSCCHPNAMEANGILGPI